VATKAAEGGRTPTRRQASEQITVTVGYLRKTSNRQTRNIKSYEL